VTGEKGGIVQKMKVQLGQGIAGIVAQERKTIIVNDAAHDPRYDGQLDKLTGFVTRTAICAPMIADQELVGVMELLNKKSGQGFTRDDADMLESLAALCAVSIANARVSEEQRNFFVNIIEILVTAIESRDPRLTGHSWNVAQRATTIAKHLGMQGQAYKNLYYGALLHDIGLIGVKEQLSLSQGVMTVRDRDAETSHPRVGADLIRNINLLKGAVPVIRHHHENFDGTGYPDGLAGEAIPLGARIVAVAEAIEEMRLGGLADDRIRQFIKLGQETRFDPQIVGIFLKETV
jgi:HD-GYP domain-containing protein (c-di-GMP phosphodiesterase class II)